MNITIIGAGRVGITLAVLAHRAGHNIVSVISRSKSSAQKLAKLVDCKNHLNRIGDIHPSTQLIIIATPEESIEQIADKIAKKSGIKLQSLRVFHTSGSVTSDALGALSRKGANVFSLHPIQTFPQIEPLDEQLSSMKDIFYGFEGKVENLKFARTIVKSLGGKLVQIPKERKILYHIACVFASNYSVALLGAVSELTEQIGNTFKLKYLAPLIDASVKNALNQSPAKALTGPIRRGSWKTIESHLHKLKKEDAQLAVMYRVIGKQALKMAVSQRLLQPELAKRIKKILE